MPEKFRKTGVKKSGLHEKMYGHWAGLDGALGQAVGGYKVLEREEIVRILKDSL